MSEVYSLHLPTGGMSLISESPLALTNSELEESVLLELLLVVTPVGVHADSVKHFHIQAVTIQ